MARITAAPLFLRSPIARRASRFPHLFILCAYKERTKKTAPELACPAGSRSCMSKTGRDSVACPGFRHLSRQPASGESKGFLHQYPLLICDEPLYPPPIFAKVAFKKAATSCGAATAVLSAALGIRRAKIVGRLFFYSFFLRKKKE